MATDLFDVIEKLFTKEEITDPPSDFLLHRFLASQKAMAPFCKEISLNVRDREMVYCLWQTALPPAKRAPFLPYAAAKKQTIEDPLVQGLMDRLGYDQQEAQEVVDILDLSGDRENIAHYYGVDLHE